MSSTTRSPGVYQDYYRTPEWMTEALVLHLEQSSSSIGSTFGEYKPITPETRILDAGCGDGSISRVLRDSYGCKTYGIEIDKELANRAFLDSGSSWVQPKHTGSVFNSDFLNTTPGSVDMVVMNPPFSLSLEFCRQALMWLPPGGDMWVLQRAGFVEGKKRAELFRPGGGWYGQHTFPKRGRFKGKSTDSATYCWFCFRKDYLGVPWASRLTVPGYQ